jgi:predicted O-methyltransferase YrrM
MRDWIAHLFEHGDMLRMGHGQRRDDLNLGLGWLYYGLGRLLQPRKVVVIGSLRGFVPLLFGKALGDNGEEGRVYFVDPSFVDEFWREPAKVREHFASFGVTNVEHFLMTTQDFIESEAYRSLDQVGIVFIDGHHTEEQARFDYQAFAGLVPPDGLVLFHDSVQIVESPIYGRERTYECRVKCFIDELREDSRLQILDLPFASGLTLVRKQDG